jgi:hypothetical protein
MSGWDEMPQPLFIFPEGDRLRLFGGPPPDDYQQKGPERCDSCDVQSNHAPVISLRFMD